MRKRLMVTPDTVPRLPTHVRLQFDELRGKWVVLAPEKVLWPDEISVDILKRCDGKDPARDIVNGLAQEYAADRSEIEADVIEFIQDWSDKRLLTCEV